MYLRRRFAELLVLVACLQGFSQVAWAQGAVALVGGGYGKYVRNSIIKKVLLPNEVWYEDFGERMDFSRLGAFALVIVAHGEEGGFGEQQEVGKLFDEYVKAGGHVILIGNAPVALVGRDLKEHAWIGAESWVYLREEPAAKLAVPAHPWTAGLDPDRDYYWLEWPQRLRNPTTAQLLIGTQDAAYLTVNEYGKGWAAFLARGPFPYKAENVGPDREAQVAMLERIILSAEPQTVPEQIAEAMKEAADQGVVLWQRDWEFGSKEGPQFRSPYPRPEEVTNSLSADLALGERESVFLNLLPLPQWREVAVRHWPMVGMVGLDAIELAVGDCELLPADGGEGKAPEVEVKIMARAPLIPWEKADVEPYESPFWLMPPHLLERQSSSAFVPEPLHNTVVWLELHAPEDCRPGTYWAVVEVDAVLHITATWGVTLASVPLEVTVWPVLSPQDRLFQLKAWGFGAPDDRFWAEYQRQGMCNAYLSYPDLEQVMLPAHGVSLKQAIEEQPEVFKAREFPALDFSYLDEYIGGQAARGLRVLCLQDVRTGCQIANAATGLEVNWREYGSEQVPEQWRKLWIGYYRELMAYLRSKGYRRVEPIWTDEPTVERIKQRYLPIAEMYIAAGMQPGSHWTTPGFMTPEDVNQFAHGVSDWSMYSIMMPKFFGFLREGSVRLRPDARIGQTRGGSGYLHRSPYNRSRRLCWDVWHNGASFLRTGPLFKGWLYYLNYEKYIRDEGVAGERLVAYSSADSTDLTAPLLPSPDWEAARDGADDVNLMQVLEWYVAALRESGDAPGELLDEIQAEIDRFVGADSPFNLHPEPKHYEVRDLKYDYTAVADATTADLTRAKRRVLELLERIQPHAQAIKPSVTWHKVALAQAGQPTGPIHCSAACREAADELAAWLLRRTGIRFPVAVGLASGEPGIYLGTSADEELATLLERRGWELRQGQRRPGSYVILTDAACVVVIGGDEAGLGVGLAAFEAFASPRGHWLRTTAR